MDLFNVLFARRHGIAPNGDFYDTLLGKKLGDNGVWELEKAPYFFRRSGGSLRTRLLGKEKDTIVGASVGWNQLVQNGNFADSTGWAGQQATLSVSDNVATITGTANYARLMRKTDSLPTVLAGHKYILSATIKKNKALSATAKEMNIRLGGTTFSVGLGTQANVWVTVTKVFTATTNTASGDYMYFADASTVYESGYEANIKDVVLFDLTQMLGSSIADYIYTLESGTAGSGIAKLREWGFFSEPYYAYNQGEIKSVSGLVSHKMVGKNRKINDGLNYTGEYTGITVSYNSDTQEYTLNGTTLNPGNIDLVRLPKETLSFLVGKSATMSVLITGGSCTIAEGTGITYGFALFNTNSSGYLRGTLTNEQMEEDYTATTNDFPDSTGDYTLMLQCWRVGSVFNNLKLKIMIELGNTATDYAPYHSDTYALDSSITLRGLFKMDADHNLYADGDTYEADGTVTRKYAYLTLNTADMDNTEDYPGWKASGVRDIVGGGVNAFLNTILTNISPIGSYCAGVNTLGSNDMLLLSKSYFNKTQSEWIALAMDIEFVIPLATQTTDSATPFASPQKVDKDGTEEYVTTQKFIPIGHNTEYKCSPTP